MGLFNDIDRLWLFALDFVITFDSLTGVTILFKFGFIGIFLVGVAGIFEGIKGVLFESEI